MFIVTNRDVREDGKGLDILGSTPNSKGPNELRLVEAEKKSGRWRIELLPDEVPVAMRDAAGLPDLGQPTYASEYVAHVLFRRLRESKKNLLFFVHGFNNDVKAVLDRANKLQQLYGVEVLSFSWPADGGGLSGVASYKSDKRDARASVGAFDRTLGRIHELLVELTEAEAARLRHENEEHALWVDRIPCRKGVYITINENDSALRASRIKTGEQQRARLGHYRHSLDARQAIYVDFTDAPGVGSEHSYFEGAATQRRDSPVRGFFHRAFNGERAEQNLAFEVATRMYRFR